MSWEDKLKRAHDMQEQRYTGHIYTVICVLYNYYGIVRMYFNDYVCVTLVHREMQLAEMGIALHVEGGALGVFSPKNVRFYSI